MGKRPRSGGKGGRGGQTDTGRQLGKQEASKHAARMLAQKTRLQRALARAEALAEDTDGGDTKAKALLAVHEDGVVTYRNFAHAGEEWVQVERLKHLGAIFELVPDSAAALSLREEYVLTLLDQGEAAQARKVLEGLGDENKSKAVYAWSLALVELVAWKGAEEGASEAMCGAAVEAALKTNAYIGIFLSNLDCYMREIDPTDALPLRGRLSGSVEEALAYTGVAAGLWVEFDEDGCVMQLVGERLEAVDVVWPPLSEGATEKFLRQFLEATEIAEKEAEEGSGDGSSHDELGQSEAGEAQEQEKLTTTGQPIDRQADNAPAKKSKR